MSLSGWDKFLGVCGWTSQQQHLSGSEANRKPAFHTGCLHDSLYCNSAEEFNHVDSNFLRKNLSFGTTGVRFRMVERETFKMFFIFILSIRLI